MCYYRVVRCGWSSIIALVLLSKWVITIRDCYIRVLYGIRTDTSIRFQLPVHTNQYSRCTVISLHYAINWWWQWKAMVSTLKQSRYHLLVNSCKIPPMHYSCKRVTFVSIISRTRARTHRALASTSLNVYCFVTYSSYRQSSTSRSTSSLVQSRESLLTAGHSDLSHLISVT